MTLKNLVLPSEVMWAIIGPHGIYGGSYPTRVEAVADHVWGVDGVCYDAGRPSFPRALNDDQRRAWRACKRRGDRAVKVRVTALQ